MQLDRLFKVELLLTIVQRLTNYDFTHYAMPVMQKRIDTFLEKKG